MINDASWQLRSDKISSISWFALAVAAVFAICWYASLHMVLQAAWHGYTPVGMMHPTTYLPNFDDNFPNGEGEMMKSLAAWAYWLLGNLQIPVRPSVMIMVTLEATTLIGGAFLLARQLNPQLPVWTAIAAGLFVSAGSIANADFARWFHPYYGSVYSFTFGLGFAALAATFQKRLVLAGLLIGVSACIHPIIALFLGLAMGIVVLADFRSYSIKTIFLGVFAAAAVFGAWYFFAFRGAEIAGDAVDPILFTTLTRLMSYHWHPIDLGVFGSIAWEKLLPFCSMVVVFFATMALGHEVSAKRDRQILIVLATFFLISMFGLWISATSTNPLLIKLAFHRVSLVLLLVAAVFAVPRLMVLAVNGPILVATLAAGLLLIPFFRNEGLPVAGAGLFAMLVALGFAGPVTQGWRRILFGVLGVVAIVCIALIAAGYIGSILHDTGSALRSVETISYIVALLSFVAARLLRAPVLAAGAVAIGLIIWAPKNNPMPDPDTRATAAGFLEVQHWARDNTPPESVFMTDPVMAYAWRQYSQRPSFGTLREWLYAGWGYNSNAQVMNEGVRRAALLGIGADDFTPKPGQSIGAARDAMVAKAGEAYATMDAQSLNRLAAENGISYFVMNRKVRPDMTDLDVVFENESYAVVKPSG